MHEFFGDVAQVLPILEGPQPCGAFRQQLRTVENARDRLGAGRRQPVAASRRSTPDSAARTRRCARSAGTSRSPGQNMAAVLDELGGKIDELDRVRSDRPAVRGGGRGRG